MPEEGSVRISVVIPTLNAGGQIDRLLSLLEKQTVKPEEILVIDSASTDDTLEQAAKHFGVKTLTIPRASFNHGGTRDEGVKRTRGEIIIFLTQDAIPASEQMIEHLTAPLKKDALIIAAYGRQLPRENSTARERLVRMFNYPDRSRVNKKEDIAEMGIKTFFFSNVCSAYRRQEYLQLGGFETDLLSNEDMFFAAKAIRKGYYTAYIADAQVFHSHDFSLKEQYERNRLQGYEIERHKQLLEGAFVNREGVKMLLEVTGNLIRQGRIVELFGFVTDCAARYLGSRKGKLDYLKEIS